MKNSYLPLRLGALVTLVASFSACGGGGGGGGGGPGGGDVAPATPGSLAVVGVSASSVTVAWLDLSNNETGFRIERSEASGAFAAIGAAAVDQVQFVDAGLTPATDYSYRVVSTGDREGPPSNVVMVTTEPAPLLPAVTAVVPDSAFVGAQTGVRILGENFGAAGTNTVSVGAAAATSVNVTSPTELTAVFPGSATTGSLPVSVATPVGMASRQDAFSWVPYPATVDPNDRRQISDLQFNAQNIRCAVDGDRVYAVWEDNPNGLKDIYFNHSLDGGVTWQTSVRLDTDPAGTNKSEQPRIHAADGAVSVTWRDERGGAAGVYCNRSLDSGATWLPSDVRASVSGQNAVFGSGAPTLFGSGQQLIVGYIDTTANGNRCYVNYSSDAGATWAATDVLLGQSATPSPVPLPPRFARVGGVVLATWGEFRSGSSDVLVARSADGGASWGAAQRVDTDSSGADAIAPRIANNGQMVSVVWRDFRNLENLYHNRSMDGGVTWGAQDVQVNSVSDPESPQLAVAQDGTIHVAWVREAGIVTDQVFHSRSTDGGATFSNEEVLNTAGGSAREPRLMVSGQSVVVGWNATFSGFRATCNASRDGGSSWQAQQALFSTAASSADFALRGARIFCTWTSTNAEFGRSRAN